MNKIAELLQQAARLITGKSYRSVIVTSRQFIEAIQALETIRARSLEISDTSPIDILANDFLYAAQTGDVEKTVLLLNLGVDINVTDPYHGMTAVMLAALFGQENTLKILIGRGADLTAKTVGGETALLIALRNSRPALANLMETLDSIAATREAAEQLNYADILEDLRKFERNGN